MATARTPPAPPKPPEKKPDEDEQDEPTGIEAVREAIESANEWLALANSALEDIEEEKEQ